MIENLYSYYIFMVADYRSAKSWSWSFSRYSIWLICPSVSVDCVPWRRLEIQEQVCISIHRYICTHGYLHRRAGHLFSYINGRFGANFHSLSYSWESLCYILFILNKEQRMEKRPKMPTWLNILILYWNSLQVISPSWLFFEYIIFF